MGPRITELDTGWESVACDFCGSTHWDDFLAIAPSEFEDDPTYTLVKCSRCKLVFLNPRPRPRIIARYYGSDYYAHVGMNNGPQSRKRRLRLRFMDGLGGYDQSFGGRLIHA